MADTGAQGHVLGGDHAVAEIVDPGAARVDRCRQRPRLGQALQRRRQHPRTLLKRGAAVWRAEVDGVADLAHPGSLVTRADVTGRADHERAQRVADQHELAQLHRPVGRQQRQQARELLTVLGDRQAAVVAQQHRRDPELGLQARRIAVGSRRAPARVGLAEAVQQDATRPGASGNASTSAPRCSGTSSPARRIVIGIASALPPCSSASPNAPFSAARTCAPARSRSGVSQRSLVTAASSPAPRAPSVAPRARTRRRLR